MGYLSEQDYQNIVTHKKSPEIQKMEFHMISAMFNQTLHDEPYNVTESCQRFMNSSQIELQNKLADSNKKLSEKLSSILTNTGYFPGYMGRFVSCKETPSMKYYIGQIMQVDKKGQANELSRTGVCAPDDCDKNDVSY